MTINESARAELRAFIEREFATAADVARMLDVSRQRVNALANRDDFPKPLELTNGDGQHRWYLRSEVREWQRRRRERLKKRRQRGSPGAARLKP